MKTWHVVYQDTPYAYSAPASLVIEAETEAEARTTATDHLIRKGKAVFDGDQFFGRTHIRSCKEYTVTPKGRVIG